METLDNEVILTLKAPQRVLEAIPTARALDAHRVSVPWDLDEMQVLKNLGIKNPPSPILKDYAWPGMYSPFDHQRTTAAFLTLHRRAFCLNEAGTGKTGAAIWAADYLMTLGKIKRCLVVCPLSIMDSAWRGDLFRVAMHRTADIACGTRDKREKVIRSGAEFVIINPDGLHIVRDAIKESGFDLIIVDEATFVKNVQTRRWKTLHSLLTPGTWLWLMTGTPAAQSPVDAYGLAKLVNPEGVPRYLSAFRDMVQYKVGQFRWLNRPQAPAIVHSVLQPAIRFTKEECLDLPPMLYVNRDVPLTPQQAKYYELLRNRLVVEASGERITAVNAGVGLSKLLQISCGAVYTDDGETLHFDIRHRYDVLREVIDETDRKVLIFVPFSNTIERLSQMLSGDGYEVAVIDGSVPAGRRGEIFDKFQTTPQPRILLIQPQAAAHGVTLTEADTIVWWGPTSRTEIYHQANARAHRAGQKSAVTVVRLVGSAAERRVYEMLDGRIEDHEKLISLYKSVLD